METNGTAEDKGQRVSLPDKSTLLKVNVSMGVTRLFKNYLFEFEALVSAHDEALAKLKTVLPPEQKPLVDLADYLSDDKVSLMRKRVLTLGNNLIRDLEATIDNLKIG